MNILTAENLTKIIGDRALFRQLSLGIGEGERIGLIGVNGSGKSTLLQIVAGLIPADEGEVIRRSGLKVEYLAQSPAFEPEATVLEAIFQSENPVLRLVREYEAAVEQLSLFPDDPQGQRRLAQLQSQMDAQQAWAMEAHAKAILTRLGIQDTTQLAKSLSGGQRKRVALARALIQPSDLLILDEPTNHIDNETVAWLEAYLARFTGALLLITHDRYFLDRVTTRILELDGGQLYSYAGNYATYLEQKAEREEVAAVREQRRQNLLRRELAWLRRGAQARSTKQKARIQRVEELQATRSEGKGPDLEIALAGHRLGRQIVEIRNVSKRFGDQPLIDGFSYNLLAGDRVGIVGPNGSGKSTLLNLIAGRLLPDQGEVVVGQTVRLGYYDQESTGMDPEQRVIDYIKDVAEVVRTPDGGTISASQMLERFLFPPRVQWTPIGKLSGGERRRLYLLRTLMAEPNVLLLDEPTNDLDIQTLSILEEYLEQFPGVVVAVSHDRYFLDRVVDHLFAFEGGRIRPFVGGYSEYVEARQAEEMEAAAAVPAPKQGGTKADAQAGPAESATAPAPKRALKLSFKEQKEWESIESVVAGLEAEEQRLAREMEAACTNYALLQELATEHERVATELNQAIDRWAELTEKVEAIEQERQGR